MGGGGVTVCRVGEMVGYPRLEPELPNLGKMPGPGCSGIIWSGPITVGADGEVAFGDDRSTYQKRGASKNAIRCRSSLLASKRSQCSSKGGD